MEFSSFLFVLGVGFQTFLTIVVSNSLLNLAISKSSMSDLGWAGLIIVFGLNIASLFFWFPCLKKL